MLECIQVSKEILLILGVYLVRTIVEKLPVNTSDQCVIISTDGILKRKFLLRLLGVKAVAPSWAVVTLLHEALEEIERLYDSLPAHFGVSERRFKALWGGLQIDFKNNLIRPTEQAVDLLYKAHLELKSLIRIEKMLRRKRQEEQRRPG